MALWKLKNIQQVLVDKGIASGREAESLAGWIWEEGLGGAAHQEKILNEKEEKYLEEIFNQLSTGLPIQYIIGHAWFYGLKFRVSPSVLIPRPETEELVEWILNDLKSSKESALRILDIGTGSGCIAITLKKKLSENVRVTAIDISPEALSIAKENAQNHEVDIHFVRHDFLTHPMTDQFDIIVSNPPYVSEEMMDPGIIEELKFEPALALFPANGDPEIFYKMINVRAADLLKEDGRVYMEMNEFRVGQIVSIFEEEGWKNILVRKDLQGAQRMLRVEKASK
jgi:release factor glutamine methyltransferase